MACTWRIQILIQLVFLNSNVKFDWVQMFNQKFFTYYLQWTSEVLKLEVEERGCNGICGDRYDFEKLPGNKYMNIMLESRLEASEIPVLAHGTYIEGGILPVVAMKSLLGSPSKDYYLQKKTEKSRLVLQGFLSCHKDL